MPAEIQKLADRFLQNPERVEFPLPAIDRNDGYAAFRRDPWQGLREARDVA